MAEREGFEPPIELPLCLISSQVHSTGLCHLSVEELAANQGDSRCRSLPLYPKGETGIPGLSSDGREAFLGPEVLTCSLAALHPGVRKLRKIWYVGLGKNCRICIRREDWIFS